MVEHDLAKVGVASSSLVSRSSFSGDPVHRVACQDPVRGVLSFQAAAHDVVRGMLGSSHRPGGRVVMQRTANPRTPVQFRPRPPVSGLRSGGAFFLPVPRQFFRAKYSSHRGTIETERFQTARCARGAARTRASASERRQGSPGSYGAEPGAAEFSPSCLSQSGQKKAPALTPGLCYFV